MIRHLMTQILRFLISQLHHCNINGAIIKIICLREIVYWKKNLFLLPTGQAGKSLIDEIFRLTNEWIHESSLKDIAFKTIIVMAGLLLQKLSRKSKSKDHFKLLENRMKLWHAGENIELLKEAETIQKDLKLSNTPSNIAEISKNLLIRSGRVILIVQ